MASLGSPVGLLITPQRIRLYRDRYLPSVEDSITEVGNFNVKEILRFRPTQNPQADSLDFERNVQSWLEGLSTKWGLPVCPPNLKSRPNVHISRAHARYRSVRTSTVSDQKARRCRTFSLRRTGWLPLLPQFISRCRQQWSCVKRRGTAGRIETQRAEVVRVALDQMRRPFCRNWTNSRPGCKVSHKIPGLRSLP